MEHVEQRQELHGKYIDRLGDNYEQLYREQLEFHQQYRARLTELESHRHASFYPSSSYPPPPPPLSLKSRFSMSTCFDNDTKREKK